MGNRLKFGIFLPTLGVYHNPLDRREARFDEIRKMVEAGEERGFYSIWVPDHIINPTGSNRAIKRKEYYAMNCLEAWTTLSALSTVTEKIRLSNIVLCNVFRHPPLLAKMAATLDAISDGRLILSIGAGWFKEECLAYGIPWYPYRERVERLRESIAVMKTLWTDKIANFQGKYFNIKDAYLAPKPFQKPHPPIWIGGRSDNMMKIVTEMGNGWDLGGPPHEIEERIASLRENCRKFNRDPDEIQISHSSGIIRAEDYGSALKKIQPVAEMYGADVKRYASSHLLGSEREMVEQVEGFAKAGVDHLTISMEQDVQQVKWFSDAILSRFR